MTVLKRFWKDESGVSSIEYAVIAAVIVIALLTIMVSISNRVKSKFNTVNNGMSAHSEYSNA